MRKLIIASFLIFFSAAAVAQNDSLEQLLPGVASFDSLQGLSYKFAKDSCTNHFISPKYSLGNRHFAEYLKKFTKYPSELSREWKGYLILSFIISDSGHIKDINVIRSPHERLSNDLTAALNKLKSFAPAKCNGQPIDILVYYTAYFTGIIR